MSLNIWIIDWYTILFLLSFDCTTHILFSRYYLHRPLCKDQAFRSEGKTDWKKEENLSQDGKFESVLQWIVCLPSGAGTITGKLRFYVILLQLMVSNLNSSKSDYLRILSRSSVKRYSKLILYTLKERMMAQKLLAPNFLTIFE